MIFLNMVALLAHRLLAHQLRQQGVTAPLRRSTSPSPLVMSLYSAC